MCDRQVALLGDGAIRDLPGGVEQYLDLRAAAKRSVAAARGGKGDAATSRSGEPVEQAPAHSAAEIREARKELSRIERQLSKLARAEERIHADMAARSTDHAAVLELNGTLRGIVDERETLEMEWLTLAEIVG
jgi:hypothetical protein